MTRRLWPACFLATLTALAAAGPARAQAVESGVKVYQDTLKSTVWVVSNRGQGRVATGSGALIDRRRQLVLTNYHVVGDVDRATVYFPDFRGGKLVAERDYYRERARELGIRGHVVARDKRADLALIQIDRVPDGAQALPLSSEGVSPGQTVHSIGNPGGSGALWVYTPGKVRQVYQKRWAARAGNEEFQFEARVIETDSPTNPGDSGGPLVNDKGELVGVTQGGAVKASLLSTFIDVSEVQSFLNSSEVRAVKAPGGQAEREPHLVRDQGKFFGAEAVNQANQEVRLIAHRFGRDLLIETYSGVPEGQAERVRTMTGEERNAFFRDWARRRARAEGVNGVTVLICRDPSYLYVNVSETARAVFDPAAEKRLRELLLAKFRERKYDEGLLAAVRFVRDKLAEQKP
jgi:S1-C subfamily serine protease